jgi:hypothetical protein
VDHGSLPGGYRNGNEGSSDDGQDHVLNPEGQAGADHGHAEEDGEDGRGPPPGRVVRKDPEPPLPEAEDVQGHHQGLGEEEGDPTLPPNLQPQGLGDDGVGPSSSDPDVGGDGGEGQGGGRGDPEGQEDDEEPTQDPGVTRPPTPSRRYMMTPRIVRSVGVKTPAKVPYFR